VDRQPAPTLLPILRSQQQGEILALLLGDPDLELSLTEIAARTGAPHPSVYREIQRAEQAGLVTSRKVGNTRLVRADTASPYYAGLAEVLTRAFGVPAVLAEVLSGVDGITARFQHLQAGQGGVGFARYHHAMAGANGLRGPRWNGAWHHCQKRQQQNGDASHTHRFYYARGVNPGCRMGRLAVPGDFGAQPHLAGERACPTKTPAPALRRGTVFDRSRRSRAARSPWEVHRAHGARRRPALPLEQHHSRRY